MVRDVEQLGRPLDQVITHYLEIVKPSFEQFTLPVQYIPCLIRTISFDLDSTFYFEQLL